MPKKNDEEEEDKDDSYDDPFDFFKLFSDPNNFFRSKQFQQLFKEVFDAVRKNLPSEFGNLSREDFFKEFAKNKSKFMKGPIMYGFNIDIGPDGKPKVGSFGNIKPKQDAGETKVDDAREPLVEVEEEPNHIIVIAEMPGVTKEDVELKATSHSLTISTKSDILGRQYYKEIELPSPINSDYAKARIQNGILEVKLKKIPEEQKNIKID